MFIGFFIVAVVCFVEKICMDHNIRIRMPEVCPPSLVNAFSAILPLLFSIIIVYGIDVIVGTLTGGAYGICSGFIELLRLPLGAMTSVPGVMILTLLSGVFWCFGIHGSLVIYSLLAPSMIEAFSTNAAAFAEGGLAAVQFYPVFLFLAAAMVGGCGNTFGLVLLGLRAKSEQIRSVSKISLVPGWFSINEPLMFGMPIMYNPVLCIPYLLNILVMIIFTFIAYQFGIFTPQYIPVMTSLPIGFTPYLDTLQVMNFIWPYLMIIPTTLIWYPFFKVYDNQLYKQEQEAKQEQETANEEKNGGQ